MKVTLDGRLLSQGTDYILTWKNNKNVGKATVTVKGAGAYDGTRKKTFLIVPKGTTIKKLTAAKKAFTIQWKKQKTQTTGYQIRFSLKKDFKSGVKTVTINKVSVTSRKITGLKSGKTYYVQIRTFKKVSGTRYYSAWSKKKQVKTK